MGIRTKRRILLHSSIKGSPTMYYEEEGITTIGAKSFVKEMAGPLSTSASSASSFLRASEPSLSSPQTGEEAPPAEFRLLRNVRKSPKKMSNDERRSGEREFGDSPGIVAGSPRLRWRMNQPPFLSPPPPPLLVHIFLRLLPSFSSREVRK